MSRSPWRFVPRLFLLSCLLLGGLSAYLRITIASSLQQQSKLSQQLPITAQVKIEQQVIQLEVAQTLEQKQIGLMNRKELPTDRGMLFPFERSQVINLWMKNTLIPLDVVFLQDGTVKHILQNVPPCQSDPCPAYSSVESVNQMLELPAGQVAALGIEVGDHLVFQPINAAPSKPK